MVINQVKSGKAVESDSIAAEALKSDREVIAEMFHCLFMKIGEKDTA